MSHTASLLDSMHFALGGANILMSSVDPGGILRAIQEHAITHLFVPRKLLYMMLSHPFVDQFDYSSLQQLMTDDALPASERYHQAVSVFGPVLSEVCCQLVD